MLLDTLFICSTFTQYEVKRESAVHQESRVNSSIRASVAERMLNYYRTSENYFPHVHDDGAERPNQEEREMYRVVAKHHQRKADEKACVLELGCGRARSIGALLELLGESEYFGIEASATAVKAARIDYPTYDIRTGDITALPFSASSFDIVVFNYVLEHLPEPYRVLDEALRVLRPGGLVAMIVPVCDLPWGLPSSLRYRSRDMPFTATYAARRWLQQIRLRYVPNYFAFELVDNPQVLADPESSFQPDDDLVYIGTTLEITKYLRHNGCSMVSVTGRDISPYVRSGRRPLVDLLRTLLFATYRCSLLIPSKQNFTTTVSVVARKSE
jgi:SAM-dependent methyltransferase